MRYDAFRAKTTGLTNEAETEHLLGDNGAQTMSFFLWDRA
jgi:hypothetical protein